MTSRISRSPTRTCRERSRAGARAASSTFFIRPYTAFHGLDVNIETLDLRTIQYLNPEFLELKGTVSGTARLDSSWLDVRFSNADIVHHDGDLPTSRFTGAGRVTDGEEYMTYDMALQAAPVSMTTIAHSYPSVRLRGNYTGPMTVKGQAPALDVVTTLTGAGGTIAYTGMVDANLPDYGAHGRARFPVSTSVLSPRIQKPRAPTSPETTRWISSVIR